MVTSTLDDRLHGTLYQRLDGYNITDADYRSMFYQLWGACATDDNAFKLFELIVNSVLDDKDKELKNGNKSK